VSAVPAACFSIDLRSAQAHLVGVELTLKPQHGLLRWSLPGWTPGSYLIRDYVRQLEGMALSQQGDPIPVRRIGVAAWQAELASLAPVTLRYQLMATELTVRTCHLTGEHGFLCLAAVAVAVEGLRWQPHQLSLSLPPGWHAYLPLPLIADGHWLADDFDQLVDSPVEAGPHRQHHFAVAGVPHRWVTWGSTLAGGDPLDGDVGLLTDVERVCRACCRLMGVERPAADHYLFVLHLTEAGYGGLEHDCSSVLQYSRRKLADGDGRRKFLQLVAHEYLHQWNVRRLRPAELVPYDYERPVVVPSLWFAEGVTSYVDQLLPHAAGISCSDDVLRDLGSELSRYRLSAGRRVQSLRQSSEEAWVKLYKPDAYSANSQVSYYLKGAVVSLALDLHLRRCGSCLPAVLRQLWRSHGCWGRGYREADLLAAFIAGAPDLAERLPSWLEGTDDPDLDDYLADVGLMLHPHQASIPWLGWQLEVTPGMGLQLQRVMRAGPAEEAGLMVGDELIALAGMRLRRPDDLPPLLAAHKSGPPLSLHFVRDGRLITTSLLPGPPQVERWSLEPLSEVTDAMIQRRGRWLALEAP
jgi:predicted metalloprotease with PDZ domain